MGRQRKEVEESDEPRKCRRQKNEGCSLQRGSESEHREPEELALLTRLKMWSEEQPWI